MDFRAACGKPPVYATVHPDINVPQPKKLLSPTASLAK